MGDGSEVSERWAGWRAALPIEDYEARFERLQASGAAIHGEADFLSSLGPRSVLDAGCGTGRVAIELARRGIDVVGIDLDDDMLGPARRKAPSIPWFCADLSTFELDRTFDIVAMPGNVMIFCRPEDRAPIVARCAAHLELGGLLVAGFSLESTPGALTVQEFDEACTAAGLRLLERFAGWNRERFVEDGSYQLSVHRLEFLGSSPTPRGTEKVIRSSEVGGVGEAAGDDLEAEGLVGPLEDGEHPGVDEEA